MMKPGLAAMAIAEIPESFVRNAGKAEKPTHAQPVDMSSRKIRRISFVRNAASLWNDMIML